MSEDSGLASFLPMDRRQALARAESLPDRVSGAALLADISGFTALTERLRQEYPVKRAAEEITRQLDRVYGGLISEVHRFGGSVIGFSGDAITCWFEGDDGRRATHSALAMTARMASPPRTNGDDAGAPALPVKVAVQSGKTRRFLLGDPDIQRIDTLAGRLLDRLGWALDAARASEVVVGDQVAAALAGDLVVSEIRPSEGGDLHVVEALKGDPTPQPWPDCQTLSGDTLEPWILPRVRQRLAAGGEGMLAEVRPTVTVFVRFSGVDYDHEDRSGERLDEYIRWVQSTVAELDGDLLGLTIGDKGSYMLIVFGATVAHEDDTERAVEAALAILSPPDDLGLGQTTSIGICRGEMHAGACGSESRRGYTVLGRAANVAAALMMHAEPGQCLATRRVAEGVSRRHASTPRGSIELKSGESIPVFEVTAERGAAPSLVTEATGAAPLVAREREMADIVEALDEVAAGGKATVIIEGAAGIGKSRLLGELASRAAERGLLVLIGAAEQIEQRTILHPWRAVLREVFAIQETDRGEALQQRVLDWTRAVGLSPSALPLLNGILPLGLPETSATVALTGKVRADRTVELLVEILDRHRGSEPLALVLEDAHWMDPLSLGLFEAAASRLDRCLTATATREVAGHAALEACVAAGGTRHLVLDRLGSESVRDIVCNCLGVSAIPDELAAFVEDKAEGHPYFSEEIAYALRDEGLVRVEGDECRLTVGTGHLEELNFPGTVQGVITSRLDRLQPEQQVTLRVASVIGRTFPFATLRRAYPEPDARTGLQGQLRRLARLDITPQVRPPPDLTHMFRHALMRDVVYGQLLSVQRRRLHEAVARWYEEAYADDLSPHLSVLAHHWTRVALSEGSESEAREKAVRYLRDSAEQSTRAGLPVQAVESGLSAVRLLGVEIPESPAEMGAAIQQGEMSFQATLADRDPSVFLDHRPLANETVGRVIEILLEIMPASFMAGRPEVFGLAAVMNLNLTAEHGNGPAAPVVYSMYAILRRNVHQDRLGAHAFSRLAMELDRRQGGYTYPVVAFIHTWFVDFWLNPLEDSIPLSLEAGRWALDNGHVMYGCYCLGGHVVYVAAAGRPLAEVERAAREQSAAMDGRVLSSNFHCVMELQFAKALRGATRDRLSLTDEEFDEGRDVASILETDQYNQIAYYFVGRLKLHYYYREFEQALAAGQQGFGLLAACAGQVAEMELRFFHALAALARCDQVDESEREALLDRAQEELSILQSWSELCETNFGHKAALVEAEMARVQTDPVRAAACYESAQVGARESGYVQHAALAAELEGRWRASTGDLEAAHVAFEWSKDAYREWGALAKVEDVEQQIR